MIKVLRDERQKRGWTLLEVGNMVGLSKQTICNFENGHRYPSYKVLLALENLFCKNHRELFSTKWMEKTETNEKDHHILP